jgi:outer membrane biosynthesis protein TonB
MATDTKPASKPVATTPSPKPEATAKPEATTKAEASAKAPTNQAPTTQTQPTQTTTVASRPRAASTSSTAGKLASADWRNYGPLQVDWANWQSMGGSYVAPTLNGKGQPLYLAINCGARKLNTTNQSGQWKSWEAPQADFEEQLVSDLCKAKGG